MEYQAYLLRTIADQLKLDALQRVALRPGVRAVYRLTVRYHDRRAADSVGTVWRMVGVDGGILEMVYRSAFDHKPITSTVEKERFEAFAAALQRVHFDRLGDQPDIPSYGVDLWLLERAAGSFTKSVILAPELARDVYASVVSAAHDQMPELLREIRA